MEPTPITETHDDVWIPSVCGMTYSSCAIKVHRVNGVVVKIEGNPDSPQSQGRLCPKGVSGLMLLHDPNRLNVPLKRTNPQNGIGVDPKWQEITWEEAMDTIVEKLKKIRADDPRKLYYQGTTIQTSVHILGVPWARAFGSPNTWAGGGGMHCGNGAHEVGGLMHSSWSVAPDFEHCNYAIYFGASKGHAAGHVANNCAQKASDARSRGMKLVVVDPMCNFASAKATEWVPIRLGTDAALALAMVNVLLNEAGIYDAPFIKQFTNGPYLVKPDGHYLRGQSGKPQIWDPVDQKAKDYDNAGVRDLAILGKFNVDGVECQPGFQLLKDHVKKYTPEMAAAITTVPPATIRRIATEFGQAARVGSTITIDGKELPLRPAAAVFFRGTQGHKNSLYNCFAVDLLNEIVGASDVPGGCMGFGATCYGFPTTGHPYSVPEGSVDGLMKVGYWFMPNLPWPHKDVSAPQSVAIRELFPLAVSPSTMASSDQEELMQKFNVPYRPEFLVNFGTNAAMSIANPDIVLNVFKKIPFILSFSLFLDEFTDFADIVLPDCCYLERLVPNSTWPFIFSHPAGGGEWSWAIQQPIVEPAGKRRFFLDILLEISYRVGGDFPGKFHQSINRIYDMREPYALKASEQYTWEEISDRVLKSAFGEEHDLAWFKKNGVLKWPKRVEEAYWRPFLKARVPIYYEFCQTLAEEVRRFAEPAGLDIDYRFYSPLPEWLPCVSHEVTAKEFDLFAFYYRDVLHTDAATQENPWLDEASRMNPWTYNISINADTARQKGIKQGDEIWLESHEGRKVKGKARLTECIHPEAAGIASCAGHWAPGLPIAKGKGVHFNELLENDMRHISPINLNLDLCVKVKAYKA